MLVPTGFSFGDVWGPVVISMAAIFLSIRAKIGLVIKNILSQILD